MVSLRRFLVSHDLWIHLSFLVSKVPSILPVSTEGATIWFRQLARNGRANPNLLANQNGLQGLLFLMIYFVVPWLVDAYL